MKMKRRNFMALAGAASLAGCGFQLRKAPDFAFSTIVVNAPASSPLAAELRRSLAADGKVRVIDSNAAATPAGAAASAPASPNQITFDLLDELREKVVVGLNSTGQVTEFQLRSRIHFRVRDARGRELVPDTELEQHRDISFNESAVLAKEAEESLYYRDMQTDMVQQLMRRLAAIRSLPT